MRYDAPWLFKLAYSCSREALYCDRDNVDARAHVMDLNCVDNRWRAILEDPAADHRRTLDRRLDRAFREAVLLRLGNACDLCGDDDRPWKSTRVRRRRRRRLSSPRIIHRSLRDGPDIYNRPTLTNYRGPFPFLSGMPIADAPETNSMAKYFLQTLEHSFLLALRISSPFLLFGLVTNFAFGLLNRLTPQIPVYFISTPFLIALGLYLFYEISRDFFVGFSSEFGSWLLTG
jgi:hypothetical protein